MTSVTKKQYLLSSKKLDIDNMISHALGQKYLYTDEKLAEGDRTEPWKLTGEVTEGVSEIILGVGKFYIGTNAEDAKPVALTRGGGSFVVEREYRDINADGDPGSVEGRILKDTGRPKLKLSALQWLAQVSNLYACMTATE